MLIHELGHGVAGWMQGSRDLVVVFGSHRDRCLFRVPCGPVAVEFRAGPRFFVTPPHCFFASPSPVRSPLRSLMLAAAGPAASALLYLLTATDPAGGIRDFLRFSFPVTSFPSALAFWALVGVVAPLVPMRYSSLDGFPSDGLVILLSLKRLTAGRQETA